ncbi:hypothetical protein Tco_1081809 [Tanacetum coccineum]|uniref:Uncharacterized protein n=1 Tax=Tanacetum coccineum TaxID=301880 RepID=A0ABQ5HYQ4_9ASTR
MVVIIINSGLELQHRPHAKTLRCEPAGEMFLRESIGVIADNASEELESDLSIYDARSYQSSILNSEGLSGLRLGEILLVVACGLWSGGGEGGREVRGSSGYRGELWRCSGGEREEAGGLIAHMYAVVDSRWVFGCSSGKRDVSVSVDKFLDGSEIAHSGVEYRDGGIIQEIQRDESKGDYVVYAFSSKICRDHGSGFLLRRLPLCVACNPGRAITSKKPSQGLGHPVSTEPVQLSQISPILGTVSSGPAIHNGPAFHQESLAHGLQKRHRTLHRNTWTVSIFPPWVAFISLSSLESQLRLSFEIEKKLSKKRSCIWHNMDACSTLWILEVCVEVEAIVFGQVIYVLRKDLFSYQF